MYELKFPETLRSLLFLDMTLNPFLCIDLSISDSLRSVRKSVLIYETIIVWRLMIVKNILKLLIVIIFLLIGYYLYFNMPWILQYKERESSMVTEYYRKGSLQYDIITGNYVFARIKVLFGENVNEIDKKNNTTPLETALMSMSYPDRFIKMLVNNGANLNKEGHELLSEYIYYIVVQLSRQKSKTFIMN